MKRVLAVGLLVCVTIMSWGQDTPTAVPMKVLTFDEAISIAMKNSVLLLQQKNNLDINQIQQLSSYVAIGPNVNVNATASRFDGNSFNNNTGQVVNGIRDNFNAAVNANINLFSGFQAINRVKQSNQLLEAQAFMVNRTTQDVVNTVAAQYLTVMLDKELLRIAKQNFEALTTQLDQVREQTKVGARSPVDEFNQEATTKASELLFVRAQITLNNDKSLLTQTLLIDPFEDFEVELPNWDLNKIGSELLDKSQLAETAKLQRGDYLRAVRQEEAQRFGLAFAKGDMVPNLLAFGSVGSAYNDPNSNGRTFSEQFKEDNFFKQFGLQLQVPILNGFQTRSTYVQQKKLYDNAKLNRKNVEYQIQNEVIRTVHNYEGAKKQHEIAVDQLKAAEIAFQLETERYNLGVTNFVDFVNANRVYVQAEADKARAEYNLVFQRILLEYAVGTLKPEDLTNRN